MADRYETDAWLVCELWKRCREMEDQIAELKKDLDVAEEFSRKQTEIINEQETTISDLNDDLKEVTDHRDRLILESVDAGRPMPSHKPEPEITTDHNFITTMLQPDCNNIATMLQPEPEPEPEPAKEPTPEARALVNGLEPQTADRKPDPEPKPQRKVKTGNKGRHGRYTEEEVQTMADRYEGGEDATSIAKEYGCTASTVYNLMNRRGISKQKQKNTKSTPRIDIGKVWALHDAGWDVKKICEEFVAADVEKIEEILAKPRPGRPGRKKKVVEE